MLQLLASEESCCESGRAGGGECHHLVHHAIPPDRVMTRAPLNDPQLCRRRRPGAASKVQRSTLEKDDVINWQLRKMFEGALANGEKCPERPTVAPDRRMGETFSSFSFCAEGVYRSAEV